jgi:hypothetical protein
MRIAARLLLPAAALALVSAAPAAAQETATLPAEPRSLNLSYDLYGSGFRLATFDTSVETDGERYTITIDGRTAGIVNLLGQWTAQVSAAGRVAETIQPERFELSVDDDEGTRRVITFGPEGATAQLHPPEPNIPQVPAEDLIGAVDPVSALIAAGLVTRPQRCPARTPVFDGTRRFDVAFLRLRNTEVDGSYVDGFSGMTVECQARLIPVSGHWREPDSSNFWRYNHPDDPPNRLTLNVFFAPLEPGGAPVLVRAERFTDNGAFMIHLVDSQVN